MSTPKKETPFYQKEELEFFKKWHYKVYDKENPIHVEAKDYLMATVWEKGKYLCQRIISELDDFGMDGRKYWSQRGWKEEEGGNVQAARFKPYTWAKVFRNNDKGKDIFFTFGLDADDRTEAFLYKIDFRDTRDSSLNAEQKHLIRQLMPNSAKWNVEIGFDDLIKMDWASLTKICVDFIQNHLEQYDAMIDAVWGKPIPALLFKNKLV